MEDVAIRIQDISKTFHIYDRPVDRIKELLYFGKRKFHTEFSALKNISFEIKKGQFVGVVGRNGAGKSTLLKILSRELTPTTGEIAINGVVSLLQLGVGFDSELTGYQNALFASKIQGLTDEEVAVALKAIEEFADIGEFFHHPIKTYSTGMHSRLSFATAVNINPDILIVDEVLSVGDMSFSQKCLRRMHEFKQQGKTVILVSHDPYTVSLFCEKALWLKDGELLEYGEAKSVTENYKNFMLYNRIPTRGNDGNFSWEIVETSGPTATHWYPLNSLPQIRAPKAQITHIALTNPETNSNQTFLEPQRKSKLSLKIEFYEDCEDVVIGWMLYDRKGQIALHSNSEIAGSDRLKFQKNTSAVASFQFKVPDLQNGNYIFTISLADTFETINRIHDILPIEVRYNGSKFNQCGYMLILDEQFEIERNLPQRESLK